MEKRICFLYTETNGLHQIDANVDKKKLFLYARLVTLNYEIIRISNQEYEVEIKKRFIIKPKCMTIPEESIKYHNINFDYAERKGSPIENVLKEFKKDLMETSIIISHNINFHLRTLIAEYVKYNINIDFSNYMIIDTISFYHDYGLIKLRELAIKLKIKFDYDRDISKKGSLAEYNLELIKLVFFKLYSKFKKSLK